MKRFFTHITLTLIRTIPARSASQAQLLFLQRAKSASKSEWASKANRQVHEWAPCLAGLYSSVDRRTNLWSLRPAKLLTPYAAIRTDDDEDSEVSLKTRNNDFLPVPITVMNVSQKHLVFKSNRDFSVKEGVSQTSLIETWLHLLSCGHREWTNHQLIGAIFIKLMFHRCSRSHLHQCKIRVLSKPGTTLRAIWLKKMPLYYHQAFIIFLLGFHWIKTAIIIIYIFMFSTINIFLLMKITPECWVP